MDMPNTKNSVILCGTVSDKPIYSHTVKGKKFYSFKLTVLRLSGAEDTISISCKEDLLETAFSYENTMLKVHGEIRSYNNKSGVGNRLQIFIYAYELEFCSDEPENQVFLCGTLCKEPKPRVTPLGREICDLLIAVNRPLGRSDYLPCICWGRNAREAADYRVGQDVEIDGRIQSRDYIKIINGEQLVKTAYEISAIGVRLRSNDAE